ncbi:hypothetical protein SAMN04515691_1584 [Leifsonia sp. 98AMF]|nr:hypothetical protein SAMN04515690_2435 [Leifsonia sp. 197AMF]SDI95219.1 hypothetical protein SAMN04515684_1351 [Leifsonia sp. 466MF]SDJ81668.1 hypothetical protein SAMN04515683_1397 [Leifsonia sp. 157MF]SDN98777.1 hypothetical protein SAMN04515686_3554 [Leifsonia sp. 509MF]SEN06065.1 hypothetical protein SAMN04515685_1382 [Leifsonia sp. 467MF]SFM11446.1 hypothetical protein SAMN04515691_1584 [Leifsonia sp. 98AMF]
MRAARTIAAAEGWEVDAPTCQVRGEPPHEIRVAASGGRLPGRRLLRVRERAPGVAADSADIDARVAAVSEHVVGVVAQLPDRRVRGREVDAVLLDFPEHGDLDGLLARRGGVRSGEAATILLGVAAGLAALHSSGWAGPGLTGSGIVFLGDGCPALDALDDVGPWTADAAVTDAERFYALARTICLKVVDGFGMRLLAAVEAGLRRGRWPAVADSVLRVVAPESVGLEPSTLDDVEPVERRISSSRVGRAAVLVSRAMDLLDGRPGRALGERIRTTLRRRPALVAAAAVPVVAALAFVALSPAPGSSPHTAATPMPTPSPFGRTATPTATATPTPTPSSSAVAPAAAVAEAAVGAGEAAGGSATEDPVDAARAVLDARHSCFTARPAFSDCLTGVLDEGSPVVAEETAALGAEGAAAKRDFSGATLSLVERWGGAALVSAAPDSTRTPKSEPASLLLVRIEAGWRLRAVYP